MPIGRKNGLLDIQLAGVALALNEHAYVCGIARNDDLFFQPVGSIAACGNGQQDALIRLAIHGMAAHAGLF